MGPVGQPGKSRRRVSKTVGISTISIGRLGPVPRAFSMGTKQRIGGAVSIVSHKSDSEHDVTRRRLIFDTNFDMVNAVLSGGTGWHGSDWGIVHSLRGTLTNCGVTSAATRG